MAGEVVVDALPYIDQGYDEPGVREAVSFNVFNLMQLSLKDSLRIKNINVKLYGL